MDSVWVLMTLTLAQKAPPNEIVTLPPTVIERAAAGSYCNIPEVPWPTVRLRATAAVSIVTVWPLAIMASSAAVGTKPHDQVPGLLQLPEPNEVQVTRGYFGRAGGIGAHSSARCIAAAACHAEASPRPAPPRWSQGAVCE